ncbi:MAG: T9SS type A sorting domain-containing protein [Chitinophagales bacterium]
MKKLLLTVTSLFAMAFAFAGNQGIACTIDSSNTDFFNPRPDSLPCVERGNAYDQVIQIKVPTSIDLQTLVPSLPFSFVMTIDSVVIDSLTGFPQGINYMIRPFSGVLYGGDNGCSELFGNTTDPVGNYPITFHGRMTLHGMPFPPYFDGDTTVDFATVQSAPQNPFSASLDVINPGDQCRPAAPSGIINAELNAAMRVYPNPSNGVFQFQLNTGSRTDGQLLVVDALGQVVFRQDVMAQGQYQTTVDLGKHAPGLYTVQFKTTTGMASKSISVE